MTESCHVCGEAQADRVIARTWICGPCSFKLNVIAVAFSGDDEGLKRRIAAELEAA